MAINYTTTFTRLGTFVNEIDNAVSRQSTQLLGSGVGADNILDEFNDNREWVTQVLPTFQSAAGSLRSLATSLVTQSTQYLASELQNELNAPNSSMTAIVPLLIERMKDDSQTVKTNTCTVSATAATNVGNGALHVSTLTGENVTSQGLIPESVRVTCTQSVYSSGSESFEIVGRNKTQSVDGFSDPGSGPGPTLRSVVSASLLTNGSLDAYTTANVPDGWAIADGTAGTNVFSTTAAGTLHAFAKSLEFKASSGVGTVRVTQVPNLVGKRVYFLSVWLKRSGGTWIGGSTFTVKVGGTGWSVNAFSADANTLSSSAFNSYTIFLATPENVPSDVKVTIEWTSASTNVGKSVYVSGCFLSTPATHANVNYAVTRGDVAYAITDTFTCTTTNSRDGKFQDFFTRHLGYQLPSAGSPTISDGLVA